MLSESEHSLGCGADGLQNMEYRAGDRYSRAGTAVTMRRNQQRDDLLIAEPRLREERMR